MSLLLKTIEDDDPIAYVEEDDDEAALQKSKKAKLANKAVKGQPGAEEWNKDFIFDTDSSKVGSSWDFSYAKSTLKTNPMLTSVEDKIKQRLSLLQKAGKGGAPGKASGLESDDGDDDDEDNEPLDRERDDDDDDDEGEIDSEEEEASEDEEEGLEEDEEEEADDFETAESDSEGELKEEEEEDAEDEEGEETEEEGEEEEEDDDDLEDMSGGESGSEDDAEEKERLKERYFEKAPEQEVSESFVSMNLSRPIVKAISVLGFSKPTPIQARAIPLAMEGRDICACAVTGSGKTAAFMIPILERLLFRPKHIAVSRVLVLTPTRELAIQCHSVAASLAKFTDIMLSLVVGGLNMRIQEADLRKNADILVATPGRLIDHLKNSPSFSLDSIEILVLDEADRMLEEGFRDALSEIISSCPRGRQTMLFSASMTDEVNDLIRLSLNHPVRLFVDRSTDLAANLVQEFIRIRQQREQDREAILLSLCKRTFKSECIIFFTSKKSVHRMRILFGLFGLKAAELHGSLNQLQRLEALEKFRDGEADFLLCTDVAARGLDIAGITTVINMNMPHSFKQYLHRVGRTARAGRKGRAVSLVGEQDRSMLKLALRSAKDHVRKRTVPHEVITAYRAKIDKLRDEVNAILNEERQEKEIQKIEMEVAKGENMLKHRAEILSRPAKTWFQSNKDKNLNQEKATEKYVADMGLESKKRKRAEEEAKDLEKVKRGKFDGMSRKKRRKLMFMEVDNESQAEAARSVKQAKRSQKPKKILQVPEGRVGKRGAASGGARSSFTNELTSTGKKAVKSLRSQGKETKGKGPKKEGQDKDKAAKAEPFRIKHPQKQANKRFKSKSKFKRRK